VRCEDIRRLVDPYLDGELDLMRQVEIDDHLRGCQVCPPIYESRRGLRSAINAEQLYFAAPDRLRQQVRAAIQLSTPTTSWWTRVFAPQWISVAVGTMAVLLAVVIAGPMLSRRSASHQLAQEVVSAHIRSLMANHLTDVSSSDQHTVKPWFAGKLDFSPPVVDLKDHDFPLVGGRLDYAGNRPVAALAYRRGGHVINLFEWPSTSNVDVAEALEPRQGYNVLFWSHAGTSFWAVSDLNLTELRQFASLVQGGI
jgi:anti-sigma factor RsiW